MTEYRSAVDWWMKVALAMPAVAVGFGLVTGLWHGQVTAIAISAGVGVLYAALLFGLVVPIRYTIAPEGFGLRSGRMRLAVPWDRLGKVEKSSNPISSPALSLKRLYVEYRRPDGKERWVLISPVDRDAFLAALAKASPRHVLEGDVLRES